MTWQVLLQVLGSKEAVAIYTLVIMGIEKKFGFIKPIVRDVQGFVQGHKGAVKTLEEDVSKGFNAIMHSPEVAALKLETDTLKKDVTKSKVYQVATAVLHNLEVPVESLTKDEIGSVGVAISHEVYRIFGLDIPVSEIVTVINEFKTLAAEVANKQSVTSVKGLLAKPVPVQPATPATPQQTA